MSKFRSKPFEIEAVQLDRHMHVPEWMDEEWNANRYWTESDEDDRWHWCVQTANGVVYAHEGDWLIREPSGVGCYPCNADVFAAKYEPVEP